MSRHRINRVFATLRQDMDFSVRSLRRAPGLTAAILLSLVIGIAAASAVSTIAYKVILQPTGIRKPSDVLVIWARSSTHAPTDFPIWGEEYKSFARSATMLSSVGAYEFHGVYQRYLRVADTVIAVHSAGVSGTFFPLLGARPVRGRLLGPADDRVGADPSIVISTGLWKRAFAGEPNIIGRRVKASGQTLTIVGVVPSTLDLPRGAEVWMPLATYGGDHKDSVLAFVNIIGRRKPGVTDGQVAAEFLAFLRNPDAVHFQADRAYLPTFSSAVTPVDDIINGAARPTVLLLLGAGLLLLLATAVNVTILLLVRALSRRTEFAVRSALGASQVRVGNQVFVEGMALVLVGGAIALFVAWLGTRSLFSIVAIDLPRLDGSDLRPALAASAGFATLIVGALVSLMPTIVAMRISPNAIVRVRGGSSGRRVERLRSSLVGLQVAVSLCGLAGAALVVQSFINLRRLDLGFEPDHVVLVRVASDAPRVPMPDVKAQSEHYRDLLDQLSARLASLPGVVSVAPMYIAPFNEGGNDATFVHPGESDQQRGTEPMVNVAMGSSGFLRTLGIRLIAGRNFTDADNSTSVPVMLVDETYAAQMWPRESPIGKQLGARAAGPFWTVIGVIGATHLRTLRKASGMVLLPVRQFGAALPTYLAIRTAGDPAKMIRSVRTTIKDANLGQMYAADAEPVRHLVSREIATPELSAALVAGFAACILVLCAVGLYGSLAAFVRNRHYEIAIRMAIGADPADTFREVLLRGVTIAAVGAGVGLVAIVASAKLLRAVVFGIEANDPAVLIGSLVAVLCIACAACYLPAHRSARINPADALKSG